MISKKVILPVAAAGVIAATAFGAVALADTSDTSPRDSLIQKLSDKFHLNKSDVQAVFDEQRSEIQAKHEARYEDRLTQAVKDGKLTEAQKTKILAKHKELVAKFESTKDSLKDKTPEERRAALDAQRTEVEQWANDNGIDAKWLMPFGGHGRHGFGHGIHRGLGSEGDAVSPSPSPSAS